MKKLFLLTLLLSLIATSATAAALATNLKGKILLQVEQNGEAWYVNPADEKRYFMGRPEDAFGLMRDLGVGINNEHLEKIQIAQENMGGDKDSDNDGLSDSFEDAIGTNKNSKDSDGDGYDDKTEVGGGYNPNGNGKLNIDNSFATAQAGRILLQVERNGEAWYVNPENKLRYYLGRPADAFNVMRRVGLGITDASLLDIATSELKKNSGMEKNESNTSKIQGAVPEYIELFVDIVDEHGLIETIKDSEINAKIRIVSFQSVEDRNDYEFEIIDGPSELSVSGDGVIKYYVPSDSSTAKIPVAIRITNTKDDWSTVERFDLSILETEIVSKNIGPEGGTISSESVMVTVPAGAVKQQSEFRILTGEGVSGEVYGIRVDPPLPEDSSIEVKHVSVRVDKDDSQVWSFFTEYKDHINGDFSLASVEEYFYHPLDIDMSDTDDCALFYPDLSVEQCKTEMLSYLIGKEEVNKIDPDEVKIFEDEKQAFFEQFKDSEYMQMYFVKEEGEWKILNISSTSYYKNSNGNIIKTEDLYFDNDKDGRFDADEDCSLDKYTEDSSKCITTSLNNRDSDEDGWWDGIDVLLGE